MRYCPIGWILRGFSSLPLGKEKVERKQKWEGGYTLIGAAEALKKEAHIIFSIGLLVTEEIKSSPNAMFFPRFQYKESNLFNGGKQIRFEKD